MGVSKLSLRRFAALGAAVAAFICALAPAAFADEPTANITNARTGATYTDLATATAEEAERGHHQARRGQLHALRRELHGPHQGQGPYVRGREHR